MTPGRARSRKRVGGNGHERRSSEAVMSSRRSWASVGVDSSVFAGADRVNLRRVEGGLNGTSKSGSNRISKKERKKERSFKVIT